MIFANLLLLRKYAIFYTDWKLAMAPPRMLNDDKKAAKDAVETRAGRAFTLIRRDILRGKLAPNARLRLEELRDTYQVGFSPLREALMQLNSEGLVVQEKMRGFRVASVSLDHLNDLTKVRIEVETLGLQWSISHGDADWEADALAAFHRLSHRHKSEADRPGQIDDGWRHAHRAFHMSLVAACGSPLLLSIIESLFDQAERYVALSVRYQEEPRDDQAEHKALLDAILERNGSAAGRLIAEHLRRTTEKVIASSDNLRDRAA